MQIDDKRRKVSPSEENVFIALGNEVVFLKRLAIGSLYLDENLQLGEYRELSADELALLL